MFEAGDMLVYGTSGVYQVQEVGPLRHIRGADPDKLYYKLTAVRGGEVTYVPVEGKVFMRPVISGEQAEELLAGAGEIRETGCANRDPRVLREYYQNMIASHSCVELLRLIKSVNAKGQRAAQQGKRLGRTDQDFKKRAETMLCEELSAALGVTFEEAQGAVTRVLHRSA